MKLPEGWDAVIFSDIREDNDGMGVTVSNSDGVNVLDIFCSDGNHTFTVNTFGHEVPVEVVEVAIAISRERLGAFENGTALPPSL